MNKIEVGFMILVAALAIVVVITFVKNTQEQRRSLLNLNSRSNKIFLFYADWCKYSQQFLPTWESLLEKYNGIYTLEKFNIDTDIAIANKFNVKSVPQIFIVTDDKTIKKYTGEKSFSNISTFIESNF